MVRVAEQWSNIRSSAVNMDEMGNYMYELKLLARQCSGSPQARHSRADASQSSSGLLDFLGASRAQDKNFTICCDSQPFALCLLSLCLKVTICCDSQAFRPTTLSLSPYDSQPFALRLSAFRPVSPVPLPKSHHLLRLSSVSVCTFLDSLCGFVIHSKSPSSSAIRCLTWGLEVYKTDGGTADPLLELSDKQAT
ncbi:hypothetical protein E6O75_ATG05018 [Venturia nashicola]|uniref:Uncharacterized protein n=1 Tax=Venturia nashicola TaxID=86259 RepID=A0A4Z1P2K5_9PEZI|nr:hypothetical protein E6O75_ATG05018 [Venturia nashicola]